MGIFLTHIIHNLWMNTADTGLSLILGPLRRTSEVNSVAINLHRI
jgi:hypothetical protein